jgi:hypothetical protein
MGEEHALRGNRIDRVDHEIRRFAGFGAGEDLVARIIIEKAENRDDLGGRINFLEALGDG